MYILDTKSNIYIMTHIRTTLMEYKEFKDKVDVIEDILSELSDQSGFKVHISEKKPLSMARNWKSLYPQVSTHWTLEVLIYYRKEGYNGGLSSNEFIWKDVKETIFRLLEYYYSTYEVKQWDDRNECPFRMFASGSYSWPKRSYVEFATGYKSESDFNGSVPSFYSKNQKEPSWETLGDYTRFEKLKLVIL